MKRMSWWEKGLFPGKPVFVYFFEKLFHKILENRFV